MTGTIRVGLIGADIQRSKTPAMHMAEAAAQGMDLRYDLIDLTVRGLSASCSAAPSLKPEPQAVRASAEAAATAACNWATGSFRLAPRAT